MHAFEKGGRLVIPSFQRGLGVQILAINFIKFIFTGEFALRIHLTNQAVLDQQQLDRRRHKGKGREEAEPPAFVKTGEQASADICAAGSLRVLRRGSGKLPK